MVIRSIALALKLVAMVRNECDMDVGDVVLSKGAVARYIVTAKLNDQLQLVAVRTGEQVWGPEAEFYFFKVCTIQEFITAYEASRSCRLVLESLPIAAEAFKVYDHRGDDTPSIFFR